MKIPLSWKGQSLGHWAAAMMRSDKEPLDLGLPNGPKRPNRRECT